MENNVTDIIEISKQVVSLMDVVTIVFSFITMLFVIYSFIKSRKQLDKISMVFQIKSNNKEIEIDKNLTRKDCTRSEIQGVLRTKLQKGFPIYEIDYIGEEKYFENIYNIQTAKSDKLFIQLKDNELEQFGLQNEV